MITAANRLDLLLKKAKTMGLTHAEVDDGMKLMSQLRGMDQATAIYLMGYVGAARAKAQIIEIMKSSSDANVVAEALFVLSVHFERAQDIREFILSILRGQGIADTATNHMRGNAILAAGELANANPQDSEVMAVLFGIFEEPDEEWTLRDAAYRALQRASGVGHADLAPSSRQLNSSDFDQHMLAILRERLS